MDYSKPITPLKKPDKSVCFAVGTGRCGTQFLYKLLKKEPQIASHHERHPLSDTFERYCQWNELPVDQAGFLAIKQQGIEKDLANCQLSFEASAYLSLSLPALHERFNAKFIFLIRSPHKVVNSYMQKGWYAEPEYRDELLKASGIQPGQEELHHSFSRITPRNAEAHAWNDMTRIGKLAWFWKTVNQRILDQLQLLPSGQVRTIRIEDFNFENYLETADFMGFKPEVSAEIFEKLTASRPNRLFPSQQLSDWTAKEREEFEEQVAGHGAVWGYTSDTEALIAEEKTKEVTSSTNILKKYQSFRKKIKVKKKLISYLEKL